MSEVRIACSWCGLPYPIEHLVDQDDGTLLCVGCIERRTAATQWERAYPHFQTAETTGFAGSDLPQVKAGDTVTYHSEQGDVGATVLRFTGIGANLQVGDSEMRDVRRGPNEGQWDAIPPRRNE